MSAALSINDDRRHGVGGNNPPKFSVPAVKDIKDYLEADTKGLSDRAATLAAMVAKFLSDHPAITSDELQAMAADVMVQTKVHAGLIEKRREAEKRPWIDGGKAVDAFFKTLSGKLGTTSKIEELQTAFAREKARRAREAAEAEARRLQEEADRAAQEAVDAGLTDAAMDAAEHTAAEAEQAAAIAAAKPAEFSRVQSDFGASASLRQRRTFTLVDISKVPTEYLLFNESKARADEAEARKNKRPFAIPGVEIGWDEKIQNYIPR